MCRFRFSTRPSPGTGVTLRSEIAPDCTLSCEAKIEVSALLSRASRIIRGPATGVAVSAPFALPGLDPGALLLELSDCDIKAAKMPPPMSSRIRAQLAIAKSLRRRLGSLHHLASRHRFLLPVLLSTDCSPGSRCSLATMGRVGVSSTARPGRVIAACRGEAGVA